MTDKKQWFADQTRTPEERRRERLAAAYNPEQAAELQRHLDTLQNPSPRLRMAAGFAETAKQAHDQQEETK